MPKDLSSLPPLRDVIRDHNLRAEKALGQNFLLDQNLTDKIVRLAGDFSGQTVIEIGPGPGGLTRSLLGSDASHVIALEYDQRAISALQGLVAFGEGRLDVRHADALDVDLTAIAPAPRSIVANLPYNISTVLLVRWLRQIREQGQPAFASMTLMFQKEVADRILATTDDKAYGRLSVLGQWLCDVRRLFDLPPEAFTPPPKIQSTVLRFSPKALPEGSPSFDVMEKIIGVAFQQRRKMIRSSLRDYLPEIEAAEITPTLRAEDLSVSDYLKLAALVEARA